MDTKFMLISDCDRGITNNLFESLDAAQKAMHKEMIEVGDLTDADFEMPTYESDTYGYLEMNGYVNVVTYLNHNWTIVPVESEEEITSKIWNKRLACRELSFTWNTLMPPAKYRVEILDYRDAYAVAGWLVRVEDLDTHNLLLAYRVASIEVAYSVFNSVCDALEKNGHVDDSVLPPFQNDFSGVPDGELTDILYRYALQEQIEYTDWLKEKEPFIILDHADEYAKREDIFFSLQSVELTREQTITLLEQRRPITEIYKRYARCDNAFEEHMSRIYSLIEDAANKHINCKKEDN